MGLVHREIAELTRQGQRQLLGYHSYLCRVSVEWYCPISSPSMSSLQCLNAQLVSLISQDTSIIYSLKYRVWVWQYKTMNFWALVVSTVCSSLPGPFLRPTSACVLSPLLWPSRGPSGAWKIWSCHQSIVLELGEVWSPKFYRPRSWGTMCSSQVWRDV